MSVSALVLPDGPFPHSPRVRLNKMIPTSIDIALSTAFSYVFLSVLEWLLHRYFMHRRNRVTAWSGFIKSTHYKHAVLHHNLYYQQFDHEPDPRGRYISVDPDFIFTAVLAVPFVAALFQLDHILALVFSVVLALHHIIWFAAHRQMHIPSDAFFRKWYAYQWLARNHWMHHRYRQVNYNLVFPLADLLFGTYRAPNERDRELMSKNRV
ncbi:sterol desaturase family protein [Caballeronia sp. CLC5]|uniref:sterol desaturase family protein n=2 Tax=unclassified Caballeronia TaxID=2646786 RepID=UPI001F1A2A56|nr:sterol desaturase family protein [Caballeronia sp. CLC5]MCE4570761.1 sterol desaturase family protein [Caballeronia sp. CLC5]